MLPGFTAVASTGLEMQGVMPAIWETPSTPECKTCVPVRTDTNCVLVSLWCTDVFNCCGRFEKRTPYPCGVCVSGSW